MVPATLVAGYQRGRNIDIKLLFVLTMGQAYNHTWINVSLTQNTSQKNCPRILQVNLLILYKTCQHNFF